jgi:Na+/H+ antiporter NhaA
MHALAGAVALLTILAFWMSTVVAELLFSEKAVAEVKTAILYGMFLLVPALAATGGSGFSLAAGRGGPLVTAKRKRMPFIAASGVLILLPSAIFLQARASIGQFDTCFAIVQALELTAGAVNLALMMLNMRDGLRLSGRLRHQAAPSSSRST